ncbi:MAG TPA: VWA domain-containing protein [Longimicrobiales bacterium]|nr:VWA domain-containing protein [Longimicrobiales bacterium]
MKTTILLDHEPVAAGRVVRLLLRLEADAPPRSDRLPLNLSLVLDRSGSMHGGKLRAAREAAALLVRRLAPEDVVSVVAYDDQVETVAEPATGAAQAELPRQIERIEMGGSTNLSGGWLRGRELVARSLLERGVNRVILLTDGQANVGITDTQRLTGLAAQAGRERVTTTTIGFGADYNERLLRAMADAGGGNTYYIEHTDQAASIFADELQGLLDLGAQNVAVEVRPAAADLVAVHHDYPSSNDRGVLRVALGDLYAREPKPLLAEFLVGIDVELPAPVAELVVSGDVLLEDGRVERQTITLPVTLSHEAAHIEPEVRRELLLLETARARREALERRERGDFDGAADVLNVARSKLREAGLDDAELMEEQEDLRLMEQSLASSTFMEADAKYMHQRAYNSSTGRRKKDELIRRMKPKREEEPPKA